MPGGTVGAEVADRGTAKHRRRPCHRQPITVISKSDAGLLHRSLTPTCARVPSPVLGDPDAPVKVTYTPLAEPAQLDSPDSFGSRRPIRTSSRAWVSSSP